MNWYNWRLISCRFLWQRVESLLFFCAWCEPVPQFCPQREGHQQLPTFYFCVIGISLIYYLSGFLLLEIKTNSNTLFKASSSWVQSQVCSLQRTLVQSLSLILCIPWGERLVLLRPCIWFRHKSIWSERGKSIEHWQGTIFSSTLHLNKTIFSRLLKSIMQISFLCLNY